MFSLKESDDAEAANHSFRSLGSHSGPSSGPEKYVASPITAPSIRVMPASAISLANVSNTSVRFSIEALGYTRISRPVEDEIPSKDAVFDGAVCVEERLVSKQGPKKVEGRRGRGDFHVRRRGQESIFVMCEKRVTLLERDDENAPLCSSQ